MHVLGLRLLAATCIVLSAGVILNVLFFQDGGARTSRALLGKPLPPMFQQTRTESPMDLNIENALSILEELLTQRGVFQCQIHFSSSQATIEVVVVLP